MPTLDPATLAGLEALYGAQQAALAKSAQSGAETDWHNATALLRDLEEEMAEDAGPLLDAARRCAKMEEALGQIRDGAPNAVRVARAALRPEPDDE